MNAYAEPTTTTHDATDAVAMALDELALALANVPGRAPHDTLIACSLLAYTQALIRGGAPSVVLTATLKSYGADTAGAQIVARSLAGLVLRLGAWLGRGGR